MGTQGSISSPAAADSAGRSNGGEDTRLPSVKDPLSEIDVILAGVAAKDRESVARSAHEHDVREEFLHEFQLRCEREVRPAMEAVLARLRSSGGGGLIEEHPGGEARVSTPRLTLWMSLEGPLVGNPRPDRDPYLQLDADVNAREVQLSEGDMWQGAGGGHSGRMGEWQLSELTGARVSEELLGILRRAAQ